MIAVKHSGRVVLVALVFACLVGVVGVGQAWAAEPWWHVNTISAPSSVPGGEGRLVLEVSNLGDKYVNGPESPVTVVDELPAGVTATHVYGEEDYNGHAGEGNTTKATHCTITGQLVTCVYTGELLPYERMMIAITVEVAPGTGTGLSVVSVTGGGAPPVTVRRALALSDTPPLFGVENYELNPEEEGGAPDTQAGSHPFQLTTTLTFNTKSVRVNRLNEKTDGNEILSEVQPIEMTKELRFVLPPGLVGNPNPLPKCPTAVFIHIATECPEDSIVGVATPIVTSVSSVTHVPLADTTPLYAVEPAVGEPARFGFGTIAGPVTLDTSVRTGGDYGVVVSVPNITDALGFIGTQVTFWGVPADSRHDNARGVCLQEADEKVSPSQFEFSCPVQGKPQPFLIMPTSCAGPQQTTVEGNSWANPGTAVSKQYTFASLESELYGFGGCNRLSFEPSIKVAPDGTQASTPSGLTVDVHVPQEASLDATGVAQASVKNTTVTLPAGVALNPAGADGLSACGANEIGLSNPAEQSCPESAKVGTVEVHTPLLPNPLVGAAYLAQQEANPFGSLVALYIAVYDPVSGVRVKLAGEVVPDPVTGQLVSTFEDTPQLPFEDLVLHFFGGSRAPLGTPALCGSYTTSAAIEPWSGGGAADSTSEFQITSGPDGSPCTDPLGFAPSLTTGSLNIQAGAFTPFTMTMSREDGNQNLQAIQLKMPPGLLGTLSSTELCPEQQANEGTCGSSSLIGETTVSVGLGGNPYTVKGGRVYITGPYDGAPYGLSIVNPAKAGPFDLEDTASQRPTCDCLVVRAKIEVNPTTSALTITSDNSGPYKIPQIIEGIPLQIKHVNVTINRPDFTFNPTNCEPMSIGGSLSSSQGSSAAVNVPFQVTNCATLKFKPIFTVSTSGRTSRADGASLHVKLTYPKAPFGSQANIGKVKVDLPKQLPSRLTTLQKACPNKVFEANPASCPVDSRVGSATATTPVLPVDLAGPAYFVSHGGAKFPELIIALTGEGVTVYLHGETFISKAGITSSTFRVIPDVPIGTFELTLPEGSDSALAANGNLCALTKTVLVKRKVTVKVKGRSKRVTRDLHKTVAGTLEMPTSFTAQNGMLIHQETPVTVTECGAKKVTARKTKR